MDALSGAPPNRLKVWWQALRPKTLSLSLAPVLAGSAWAWAEAGAFDARVLVLAALGAVAMQSGTNLWNDALDGERGVDAGVRLGPIRATAAGLLPARRVRLAALAWFALAVLAGLGLVAIGGPLLLAIGVAGIACGLLYSSGPRPLAATPLGEVLVLAFFGVAAVAGTAAAHGGTVTPGLAALGLLIGLPAAAVLLLNNHRDRLSDRRAGRRTLAIVLGPRATCRLYGVLVVLAAAAPAVATGFGGVGIVASLALVVPSWMLADRLRKAAIDERLNGLLANTVRYQLAAALLTVLALLVTD